MKLNELSQGQHARIVKIDAPADLKNRLMSFGVIRGAELVV
jgi:Fe2+ transport system protein FeoA